MWATSPPLYGTLLSTKSLRVREDPRTCIMAPPTRNNPSGVAASLALISGMGEFAMMIPSGLVNPASSSNST